MNAAVEARVHGPWPSNPVVHEIFTWVWLADLAAFAGRPVTLSDVPDSVWDDVARPGIDAVWLMGVWQRSPEGARIAAMNPAMRGDAERALPGLVDADIVGSAYCVRGYTVDPHLGGDEGLAVARSRLAERGVRLVLDFVPNHVAPDHEWTHTHPEYFVQGTADDLARDPASFIDVEGNVLACGRDPYFPAWPEVVQLDASRSDVRRASTEVVSSIADRCDGVRCDMAMLMLDDVFARTWGDRTTGPDDDRGYWPPLIESVRATHPDFVFWAEAYWDLEPVLVEQGFDACYDKRLYDRMVHHEPASSIRAHLEADADYQRHMLRFVENHDEPRAASVFDRPAHQAALASVLTLPGVALLHEGEAEGRRLRTPVTLGRRAIEATDGELRVFVDRLLRCGVRWPATGNVEARADRGLAGQPERRASAGMDLGAARPTSSRGRQSIRRTRRWHGPAPLGRPRRRVHAHRSPLRRRVRARRQPDGARRPVRGT